MTPPIDWLTTISSFAALGAAVAALLTIVEMRKQRLAMYRPDIAFEQSFLFFYWYKDVGLGVPVVPSSSSFDPERLDLTRAIPRVFLNGSNVGLGTAKLLDADWKVDIKECIATLSAMDTNQQFTIWDDAAGIVTFESSGGKRTFQAFRHAVLYNVPFVSPITAGGKQFQLELPFAYAQFLAIYVFLSLEQLAKDDRSMPSLPAVELSLSYLDISGVRYRTTFRMRASLIYLAKPGSLAQAELCGQAELEILRSR